MSNLTISENPSLRITPNAMRYIKDFSDGVRQNIKNKYIKITLRLEDKIFIYPPGTQIQGEINKPEDLPDGYNMKENVVLLGASGADISNDKCNLVFEDAKVDVDLNSFNNIISNNKENIIDLSSENKLILI